MSAEKAQNARMKSLLGCSGLVLFLAGISAGCSGDSNTGIAGTAGASGNTATDGSGGASTGGSGGTAPAGTAGSGGGTAGGSTGGSGGVAGAGGSGGGSGGGGGGVDAGRDASTDIDASRDAAADVRHDVANDGSNSCAAMPNGKECWACCKASHPQQGAFNLLIYNCACSCTQCYDTSLCTNMVEPEGACIGCLQGKLAASDNACVEARMCPADPQCSALLSCLNGCPTN